MVARVGETIEHPVTGGRIEPYLRVRSLRGGIDLGRGESAWSAIELGAGGER